MSKVALDEVLSWILMSQSVVQSVSNLQRGCTLVGGFQRPDFPKGFF